MVRFDMHSHSTSSDGLESPNELASRLRENNNIYCITDHNTIDAHNEVECSITGVELNTNIEGLPVESLFYGFNVERMRNEPFLNGSTCLPAQEAILDELKRLAIKAGYSFDKSVKLGEFATATSAMRNSLIKYTSNYRKILPIILNNDNLFYRWCAKPVISPLYTDLIVSQFPTHEDLIKAKLRVGGYLFLAHPFLYPITDVQREHLFEQVVSMYDGIEVFHTTSSYDQQVEALMLCKQNGLYVSGGSDFHGNYDGWIYEKIVYNKLGWDVVDDKSVEWMLEAYPTF